MSAQPIADLGERFESPIQDAERQPLPSRLVSFTDGLPLTLHYQPIRSLQGPSGPLSGRHDEATPWGLEVFAGWERVAEFSAAAASPDWWTAEPDPAATVDARTLRQACTQLHDLRQDHARALETQVAVNVGSRFLNQAALVTSVLETLDRARVEPAAVCIEIPERSLCTLTASALTTLARLRETGVRIAVDGVAGNGGVMEALSDLPVDIIKIHRSTVHGLRGSADIVEKMVNTAHEHDLSVIADGVERAVEMVTLQQIGCDLAQGVYFGLPSPPEFLRRDFT